MSEMLEGLVLNIVENIGFLWCRDLGQVFISGDRMNQPLSSVLRPGDWVQFRAVRRPRRSSCDWDAVDLSPCPHPKSLHNRNQEATAPYEIRLEGFGVAFPSTEDAEGGFVWNDALGTIRFFQPASKIVPSLPTPFQIVHFMARPSTYAYENDEKYWFFQVLELYPASAEERRLVAETSSIMKFGKCRLLRLPSSEAPGVFHCPKAEVEELLCVPGADLFSSVRQLDPDCSYLIHAVPNVWDPADVSVNESVPEGHRKKWRVLAMAKEAPAPMEQLGMKEPSALAIFRIVLKDRILLNRMKQGHPDFMSELIRRNYAIWSTDESC